MGKTIQSIAEAKTIEFENTDKRRIGDLEKLTTSTSVFIDDLKPKIKKRFKNNRIEISK